jgi:hypothetical protein
MYLETVLKFVIYILLKEESRVRFDIKPNIVCDIGQSNGIVQVNLRDYH